jgi:hypothetical protein
MIPKIIFKSFPSLQLQKVLSANMQNITGCNKLIQVQGAKTVIKIFSAPAPP